jgi:hypothetical protein
VAASKPEADIAQLEALLRQLEKKYDQFLAGLERVEPWEMENQVLALIRTYASRPLQNNALAFKYGALVARYNAFKAVWSRRQREREEGRGPGAAAGQRRAPARVAPRDPEKPRAPGFVPLTEYLAANPEHEQRHLAQFFETYRRQREQVGESNAKLKVEAFQKALADRIAKIKAEQRCEAVLVRVVTENGRTRLVAKPFRRAGSGPDTPP